MKNFLANPILCKLEQKISSVLCKYCQFCLQAVLHPPCMQTFYSPPWRKHVQFFILGNICSCLLSKKKSTTLQAKPIPYHLLNCSTIPVKSSANILICITPPEFWDFAGGSDGKESACNAGDLGLTPGSGLFPGERNGNPLQYSYWENPMDRGAQ